MADADLKPRAISAAEQQRREAWLHALNSIGGEVPGRKPEPWQVELAAWILARQYQRSVTGRGDIWVMAHTTASELADAMKADGRLNEWGNWPDG